MKELSDLLISCVKNIDSKDQALDKEEKQLNGRLEQIKKERAQLRERRNRAVNYPEDIRVTTFPICPRCYLKDGFSIKLTPIPGTAETDKSECRQCGYLLEEEV
jgi:hypothetical protein